MERLIVLGTGAANALRYYNTCFMLQGPQGGLLVDGGGGNGILVQLEKAGLSILDLTDIFVTHQHIDHTLGVIWLVRMVAGKNAAIFCAYTVIRAFRKSCAPSVSSP